MKREQWGETSHQKLYQIKTAISRWVQMNISFSSKFNLSPDSERKQRRSLLVEVRGPGSSRGEYEQRLVEVTEELDAGRGFLWCVIPLSVRGAQRLREGGIQRFVFFYLRCYPTPLIRSSKHGRDKCAAKGNIGGLFFCLSRVSGTLASTHAEGRATT